MSCIAALLAARGTDTFALALAMHRDTLVGQRTASATIAGAYAQISEAHARLRRVITEHGMQEVSPDPEGAGTVVNRYLTDPSQVCATLRANCS